MINHLPLMVYPKSQFRRPLTASDIEVFQKYAKRMRAISYNSVAVVVDVEEALVENITSRPIFPNLRRLVVHQCERDPKIFHLFLGAKLDHVSLFNLHLKNGPLLMGYVERICPSVTSMQLWYEDNPGIVQIAMSPIFGLRKLESLTLSGLALLDLVRVSTLPTLRYLVVDTLVIGDTDSIPNSEHTHLTSLDLRINENVTVVNRFLSSCRPHQLQSLILISTISSPSSQWQQCFQTLSLYCSTTLKTLIIQPFEEELMTMGIDVLVPLLAFPNLTYLRIQCSFEHLGNHELKQMALAWPRLRGLDLLPWNTFEEFATEVTLVGILPLLEHCPELTQLRMPMNVSRDCIRLSDKPWQDICNRNITRIDVGNTVMENPVAAAIFFSHVLPNLKWINSWGIEEYDFLINDEDRWGEVCPLMEDLRIVGIQDSTPKESMDT
jgi:hypothetical protein